LIPDSDCGVIVHVVRKLRIVFSAVEQGGVVGMREGCCCGCCCCCEAEVAATAKQKVWELLHDHATGDVIVK
jgi:hypothetical protein